MNLLREKYDKNAVSNERKNKKKIDIEINPQFISLTHQNLTWWWWWWIDNVDEEEEEVDHCDVFSYALKCK